MFISYILIIHNIMLFVNINYNNWLFISNHHISGCIILMKSYRRVWCMYIFCERLKDLRIENGYKQDEIAKKLNVTTSAYGYYEQGRNEPSLETVKKIAQTFNVTSDYLVGLIDTPHYPVNYTVSDDLSLTESEIEAVKKMKELLFLEEISAQPKTNVYQLLRYWEFIKNEHNTSDK